MIHGRKECFPPDDGDSFLFCGRVPDLRTSKEFQRYDVVRQLIPGGLSPLAINFVEAGENAKPARAWRAAAIRSGTFASSSCEIAP